jgi:hypothetical protein
MTAFTDTVQIDEAHIPTEQDWEDVFAEEQQEFKFLFLGVHTRHGMRRTDVLACIAATGAEALATIQRNHPDFEIHRWDVADNF